MQKHEAPLGSGEALASIALHALWGCEYSAVLPQRVAETGGLDPGWAVGWGCTHSAGFESHSEEGSAAAPADPTGSAPPPHPSAPIASAIAHDDAMSQVSFED